MFALKLLNYFMIISPLPASENDIFNTDNNELHAAYPHPCANCSRLVVEKSQYLHFGFRRTSLEDSGKKQDAQGQEVERCFFKVRLYGDKFSQILCTLH